MSGNRHERSAIEAFLDGEFRQVWAADRLTGEPRFLPEGQAADLRAVAKREWRCPVPGCEVEITTVGGTRRRHHFRHNKPSPHPSDGESEFHLAAKAMLAKWAGERLPPEASVHEERWTTKDPTTSRYRIADVMVTWVSGQQTAFEVEYKNYAPEDWALKQSDYDNHEPSPITCAWLLGHLRIKRPHQARLHAESPELVPIPLLAQAWNDARRVVLAINPVTREIGTFVNMRPGEPALPAVGDTYARLVLDSIDACGLDPVRGVVTPTMVAIDEADRRRQQEEARRAAEEERQRLEQERRQAYYDNLHRTQRETWEASPLHAVYQHRWTTPPALLDLGSRDSKDQSGVWANPVHWRAVIYEELIHPFTLGREPTLDDQLVTGALLPLHSSPRFTPSDIRAALAAHGIKTHPNRQKFFNNVMAFMERLQEWKVLAIHRDTRKQPFAFEPTGYPLHKAEADYQQYMNDAQQRAQAIRDAKAARDRAREEARARAAEQRKARSQRNHTDVYEPPPPDPDREARLSRCTMCDGPLPSWQRGGRHAFGCPEPNKPVSGATGSTPDDLAQERGETRQ
ncbi:MAG: hypothetical protein KAG80_07210 [Nocardioides sp.]|nr:hypothetical protein [Nocardioides sp.]